MDLGELIKKGEVAWLSAEEMMRASEAAQTGASHFQSACDMPAPGCLTQRISGGESRQAGHDFFEQSYTPQW